MSSSPALPENCRLYGGIFKKKELIRSTIHPEFLSRIGSRKFLSEFDDVTMLKFACFFHDIGKVLTAKNGYKNHDKIGAEIFRDGIGPQLSLGKSATDFVSYLIRHHLDVVKLYFMKKEGSLKKEDINFFWYRHKEMALYLFLLTYADVYATSEDDEFLKQLSLFVIYLQEYYFDFYRKNIVEQPLLTGREIMEILNIPPSPVVGRAKELLMQQQISGKIKTKEEAIEFLKSITL
ncbi:HD domain-containing protein [Persephonella sp.]